MTPSNVQPRLIDGGVHLDERGTVSFVNGFDFVGVDRFYLIRARLTGVTRGWIGHRRNQRWFFAAQGDIQVAVVRPDDWTAPSRDLPVASYVLSSANPQVLHVPGGFATAIVHLTANALAMIFASGSIEESRSDDHRFPVNYWNVDATRGA